MRPTTTASSTTQLTYRTRWSLYAGTQRFYADGPGPQRCARTVARSSAPFVAPLMPVTGLVRYFPVALIFLKGALL